TRTWSSGGTLVAALKWRRKYKRSVNIAASRQYLSPGAMPRKKERSVFFRGVERMAHPEARWWSAVTPPKCRQRLAESLIKITEK
ncbi:MAG: hypothetical protein J6C40_13910, partial [Lentisphaeria bacterium]|nr:hypothetical protein [Lentisphaeria bacterium]